MCGLRLRPQIRDQTAGGRSAPASAQTRTPAAVQQGTFIAAAQTDLAGQRSDVFQTAPAALPKWLPHLGRIGLEIKTQLLLLSPATIDRMLCPLRARYPGKGLGGTKPGTLLKHHIPIRTSNWDITRPGFVEADTVAHCGNSLAGDFIWSSGASENAGFDKGWSRQSPLEEGC